MQQSGDGCAEPVHVKRGDPAIQEEDQIQEQQGCTQVHQDFGGIIPSQFSQKKKKEKKIKKKKGKIYENQYCKQTFKAQAVSSCLYSL